MKKQTEFKQTEIGVIPEDWEVKELGEVCQLVKKQYSPSKKDVRAYIGLEHIEQQNLKLINIGSSEEIASIKFEFKAGQILFGKLRPYFRKVYRPKFDGVCSTDIWVIDSKGQFDNGFLFYFLADQRIINEANNSSEGTRMPRARWDYLSRLKFAFSPPTEQRAIASILGSLDDKIALNRSMNTTLEAIGQALFKRWFIDFEFPDEEGKLYRSSGGEMVETELGEVPRGWRVGKLGDIIQNFDSKRVPLSSRERSSRKGMYPYYGAASIMDYVDDYIFDGIYVLMGEDGTVIDESEHPILQYVWGKIWVNNHAHVIQGKDGIPTEYILLLLKRMNIKHLVTGAVQPKINQGNMNSLIVIIPPKNTLNSFFKIINTLFEKYRVNYEEIKSLSAIRDTLLPKLMSGEIRVGIK